MSMADKYGFFSFDNITFYDKESLDKVLDEFKKIYGKNIKRINGKKVKGSGKFGLRTAEEKDELSFLEIKLHSKEDGTMRIDGFGHRRGIFSLIDFMKHYFKTRDIVAYRGSDTARRNDDDLYFDPNAQFQEMANDADLMSQRRRDWQTGKLPKPEGRDEKQEEQIIE